MDVKLGTVFWMNDSQGGHYYVVITPPSYPEVLVVNFTKQGPRKDQSCVLTPGCHPVVVLESVVSFDHAEVVPTSELQRQIDDGLVTVKDDASEELMLAIWDGAYATNRMTIRCQQLLSQTIPQ
jgi:hypothetical protein